MTDENYKSRRLKTGAKIFYNSVVVKLGKVEYYKYILNLLTLEMCSQNKMLL